jgi:hypothetical protein
MALPFSRNTTYASMSQVQSADLNDIQDVDIANIGDLILALGGSAGAPYTTLVELFDQGTFTPTFAAPADSGITYTTQQGFYRRIGNVVDADILVAWNATEGSLETVDVAIIPPFAADSTDASEFLGGVFIRGFNDGAQSLVAPYEAVLTTSTDTIGIIDSAGTTLEYGPNDARALRLVLSYRTTGTFNY